MDEIPVQRGLVSPGARRLPYAPMHDKLVYAPTVTYADVDRSEVLLLPRLFKLLQEVAIAHASEFGAATAAATRGETWVLYRIAAAIERYPRAGERLEIETWSTGIRGFKGYRDFRVRDAQHRLLATSSSVWLYVSAAKKSIIRVPREIAAGFPIGRETASYPELDGIDFVAPGSDVPALPVTLRYSDFDVNEHVNNAAYFDLLQNALAANGTAVHPRRVQMQFAKAIPVDVREAKVRMQPDAAVRRFAIESDGVTHAIGEVEL